MSFTHTLKNVVMDHTEASTEVPVKDQRCIINVDGMLHSKICQCMSELK